MLSTELLCPPVQHSASECVSVCMFLFEGGGGGLGYKVHIVNKVIIVEPPNKGHYKFSCYALCRERVLF